MNVLKASLALFALVLSSHAQAQRASSTWQSQAATRVYSGDWFEIRYPSSFTVCGSMASNMEGKFDSAKFTSPDGKRTFYVYSQ